MATPAEYFEQMKVSQSKALEMLDHPRSVANQDHPRSVANRGARLNQAPTMPDDSDSCISVLADASPGVPTIAELKELNRCIHDDAGTPERYKLDQPAALETYLTQAADAYAQDVDAVIHVAALLAYGIASAQAFCDGNRRTAYFATQSFLNENGCSFLTSQTTSDHSLARKLNQVVKPGQKILRVDDFTALFSNRLRRRRHPDAS